MSLATEHTRFTCQSLIAEHGDLSIEWPVENADKVEAAFEKLMNEKHIDFWVVEKAGMRSKVKVTEVTQRSQFGGRKVVVRDENIAALVNSGVADLVTFVGVNEIKPIRKARDAKDAANSHTMAIRQRDGG